MSWSQFQEDFQLDQVILRRIQRANQDNDEDMDDMDSEEEEEEEPEESVLVGSSRRRRVKNET